MIPADESDYACSCNCDSLRGRVLKYIFNSDDAIMSLVLFIFHLWVDTRERQNWRDLGREKSSASRLY